MISPVHSNINRRIETCHNIEEYIKTMIRQNKKRSCQQIWADLFTKDFYHPEKIGSGAYSSIYQVFIRSFESYPLALKKTHQFQFNESEKLVYTSALAEAKINPHFCLLFAHFYCEMDSEKQPESDLSMTKQSWFIAERNIKELKEQINELSEKMEYDETAQKQIQTLEDKIRMIRASRYPYMSEIKEVNAMQQMFQKKATRRPLTTEQKIAEQLSSLLAEQYQNMLFARQDFYQSQDLLLMERLDGTLVHWFQNTKLKDTSSELYTSSWLSILFQTCTCFLSLLSYYQMLQNDITLSNIGINYVPSDTVYYYKMLETDAQYVRIPLHGVLVKLIDFGSSTDVNMFRTHSSANNPTSKQFISEEEKMFHHWCRGGKGYGQTHHLSCVSFYRDILELFYWVHQKEYEYHPFKFSTGMRDWITDCYHLFRDKQEQLDEEHLNSQLLNDLAKDIQYIFSADMLSKYNLPPFETVTDIPTGDESNAFIVGVSPTNETRKNKQYDQIEDIIAGKIWRKNNYFSTRTFLNPARFANQNIKLK